SKSRRMASMKCTSGGEDNTREKRHPAIRGILNAVGIGFSSTFKIFTHRNAWPAFASPLGTRPATTRGPSLRAPIRQKLERLRLRIVERGRRERAAHDRRSVEVEAAAAQVGRAGPQRRVAQHDGAAANRLLAIGPAQLA